ncbi:zinc-dependent alcohol dehydrogenase family protein [Cupriavidus sp. SS-3]|uniref:zinc-dependent alcohol dehydrogenase family protein n=1 Tax=Cupriavidus sp. SS-3 TaxID=3109596 RepID=UPI002DC04890|nr:zinc-binding dehydrogenase [Cupriavidus sp. SS-3]MEC3768821.1 zinc-binding dehydrogenase [Cupriavidus sp. SS-3]
MRGVVFKGDRKLEIMNFPDPTPGPGEVVIEMKASGMCGSDLHFYRHSPAEVIRSLGFKDLSSRGIDENAPIIGGHEPCGVVAAIGPGVNPSAFKVGDRVMVFHYEGCSFCDSCRTGWTQLCDHGATVHGVIAHGGHADYMKVPVSSLVHLPEEVSFAGGAAISCGTGTAYGALLRLDISARDTLAVFGLGPVGLSAAQLAAAMGVEVIGVDISPDRVKQAKAFGVAHAIDGSQVDAVAEILRLTGGKGVSCAMDCAGSEVPRQQAVRCTRTWGKIALVAIGGNLNVDAMKDLIGKQRTVIGSYTFSEVGMKECAHFIARHGVEVDKLFTDHWRLEQADEAYRRFDAQAGGKGVFLF